MAYDLLPNRLVVSWCSTMQNTSRFKLPWLPLSRATLFCGSLSSWSSMLPSETQTHTRFHIMLLQCVFNDNNHLQIYDNGIKLINSWRQGFQVISNDKNIKQSTIPFSPFLVFPGRISGTLIIINKIRILCLSVILFSAIIF